MNLDSAPFMTGNAADEGMSARGWFLGHFVGPDASLAHTTALEVKWGTHAAGDQRAAWAVSRTATTVSILIQGRFCLRFAGGHEVVLTRPGDYVLSPPGVAHTWNAQVASVVLTVRWPSSSGDTLELGPAKPDTSEELKA